MNARQLMTQAHFFMELGQDSLRLSDGSDVLEMPLDRTVDGKLTDDSKRNIAARLQTLFARKSWQPRSKVYCGIGLRGVSMRRLTLPAGNKDDLYKLLPFQIEREFPLPPDQLAWATNSVNGAKPATSLLDGKQQVLVIAVKKDTLEEYSTLLANCGAVPVFTLAALNRTYVCPQPQGSYSVLAVERTFSELITLDSGSPVALRTLPWGRDNVDPAGQTARLATQEIQSGSTGLASFGGIAPPAADAANSGFDELVRLIRGESLGRALYIVGLAQLPNSSELIARLATQLGPAIVCEQVLLHDGKPGSAAVLGLQRAVEIHSGSPPFVLQLRQVKGKSRIPPREQLKWAAVAAALLLCALLIPYAEALLLKTHLANKLLAMKADQTRLAVIDRELDFLQYLQASQPPYLDAFLVLAQSASPGTRFDSVSMNRRGEITVRGSLRDGQQVADLRSKLIASGFFASVAVEEQTPTPDRQKVNVRMTAQWRPPESRTSPPLAPAPATQMPKPITTPNAGPPPPIAASAPGPITPISGGAKR